MTIEYLGRTLDVDYNYIPAWSGTYLDPPVHEEAEINKVVLNGRDITRWVDTGEIEKLVLEKINY